MGNAEKKLNSLLEKIKQIIEEFKDLQREMEDISTDVVSQFPNVQPHFARCQKWCQSSLMTWQFRAIASSIYGPSSLFLFLRNPLTSR